MLSRPYAILPRTSGSTGPVYRITQTLTSSLRSITLQRSGRRNISYVATHDVSHTDSPTVHRRNMSAATSDPLVQFGQKHVMKGLNRLTDVVVESGAGSYVSLSDGRRLLDFTSGIGVTSLGHCHPEVSGAAADQCMKLVHGQCSIAFHGPYLELIEKLVPVMPHPSLNSFFFCSSGSEAVEASIKMARQVTGRQNVIVMQGGYHGRTFGAMALTRSKTIYGEGSSPFMPGVFTTPFPYWHHLSLPPTTSEEEIVRLSLYQLEILLAQQVAPTETAAILIEPLLGEGGYVPAPSAYLHGMRDICDKHGILLIVDEVQSGFGRTGKYFATEYSGVKPDIMVIAKGIANGFPLSGIVSSKELSDKLKPGTMGGTYAGNAVACAAAIACADVMQNENVLENAQERSKELFSALNKLRENPDIGKHILDIRGLGLMVGVEFASPNASPFDPMRSPSSPESLASRVAKRCIEKGMYILTTSIFEVIRFIPPINISKEDMAKGCTIFAESVEEVVKEG